MENPPQQTVPGNQSEPPVQLNDSPVVPPIQSLDQVLASSQSANAEEKSPSSKIVYSVLAVVALIAVITGSYYVVSKNRGLSSGIPTDETGIVAQSLDFNGVEYARAYDMPEQEGLDNLSTSYEWLPKGETFETWTSLITTHKMAPKDASAPLSAEVYAQNVAGLNEKQGAVIIETSVINMQDAVEQAGVDLNNPPYLLVYAYPSDGKNPIEVDMQKVLKGKDGGLHAFVYAYKLNATKEEEINAYFQSDDFAKKRIEVIKAKFPY